MHTLTQFIESVKKEPEVENGEHVFRSARFGKRSAREDAVKDHLTTLGYKQSTSDVWYKYGKLASVTHLGHKSVITF
jgi:hypothetical protein